MNILSTLKKIFNSYDFMGNRIKNLRVDTPDESIEYREVGKNIPNPDEGYFGPTGQNGPGGVQHYVANKLYVDKKTTYNTDKAWFWQNPFFFDWIKNVQGKSYKEILDDLFFPLVQHKFISPEVIDVQIFVKERPLIDTLEIDNNFRKFVVYNRCNNKFKIVVKQNKNEWLSGLVGQLIIETSNRTYTFNSKDTNNEESVFEFEFLWDNVTNIKFKRVFDEFEPKNDTYGNPSNPPEPTFTLEKNITEYLKKTCYPFTLEYIDGDNGWIYSDKIFLEAYQPKTITLQLDNNLFDKQYCLKAYVFNEAGEFLNWFIIGKKDFTQDASGMKTYNFGYFPFNVNIQIVPQAIRLI